MKRLFFILSFILSFQLSFSQNLPDFDAIKLEKKEDYNNVADDAALLAARFLFITPFDNKNVNRLKLLQYIIRWMTGTPDYNFTLDEQATKLAKKMMNYWGSIWLQ